MVASDVRSNDLLVDALLDKIRLQRVMLDAVRYNLLHSDWLPVREGAIDVWCAIMLARLHQPVRSLLVNLFFVVGAELWILLPGYLPNPRRPNEHCHDIVAADPALVLLIREDTPLRHAWQQSLVPELPLDDQFPLLYARRHRALIIDPHRLDNVTELQPLPNILPLLVLLFLVLQHYGLASIDLHQAALHGSSFLVFFTVLDLLRGRRNIILLLLWRGMNPRSDPIDEPLGNSRVAAKMQASERLRFAQ